MQIVMYDRGFDPGYELDLHLPETEKMENLLNRVFEGDIASIRRASYLGKDGADAVPELMVCLTNQLWRVRLEAVQALGRIGETAKAAVPKLVKLKEDQNQSVREAVDEALASIQKSVA